MLSLSAAHGRFVWHELMTTDIPAALAFYTKVVGWSTEAFPTADAKPYTMWKAPGGAVVGGAYALPEEVGRKGVPPHWMGNLCVKDVDAAVAKVAELGGRIHQPPFDVPEVGRVAIVSDPTGATLALYQPSGEAPGHEGAPTTGEISWNELYTTDPDAAWAFYSALVGWKKTGATDMGPMGTYQHFGPESGGSIGGIMRAPPGMPSIWMYYVYVADLDGSLATATGSGARVVNGPVQIPGGDRVVTLTDPQGAFFSLHGR